MNRRIYRGHLRPSRFSVLLAFLCSIGGLAAEMTPSAPVKNFSLPRFAENGYTQWVLKGGQGIYDSEEQVRVLEMALRVYSADERMALEMSMDSPEARLLLKENQAVSDAAIGIEGANFELSGRGWRWDGNTKVIEVDHEVEVRFIQDLSGSFEPEVLGSAGDAEATVIQSERLRLQTTPEVYRFLFGGSVRVRSGTMDLTAGALLAIADAPDGRAEGGTVAPSRIDTIRQIIARKDVVIEQGERVARAGEAEFLPGEGVVYLRELPGIEVPGAYVSGARIRLRRGEVEVEGSAEAGRAQTILTRAGGLGLQGSDALTTETIVLADRIELTTDETGRNVFSFAGSVEVMSGELQLVADKLLVHTVGGAPEAAEDEAPLAVGEVRRIRAEGGVRIERGGQIATGDTVVFYPAEERAILSGNPRVWRDDADVRGARLHLMPDGALAESEPGGEPVRVTLPVLPDLGYDVSSIHGPAKASVPEAVEGIEGAAEPGAEGEEAAPDRSRETVVLSRSVRMTKEPEQTRFRFSDEVRINATNLKATCDTMEVTTRGEADPEAGDAASGLKVERIDAEGAVVIDQGGRHATSEKATILPGEGKLVLEGKAVVSDERGEASGHRLTLLQGERRAIVEGDQEGGERARITLPGLPE